jgi:putative MATE family efflux protein
MQYRSHSVLESEHIGRLLTKLTAPLLLGMSVQMIYNVVDTIFIGHYVGTLGLAGLSVVFPLWMMAMGIGQMVGIGGASLISRLIGSKDRHGAELALGNAIAAGFVLSALMTVIIVPSVGFWIKLLGVSANVVPFAKDYLTIVMSGTVFNVLSNALIFYTRAEGNARVAMVTMILSFGLNIILDAVFMIPLGMGMKGAALAMVISMGIATLYALSYYGTGRSYLKLHLRNFIPDVKILRMIFAIGVAQLSQTISTSLAAIFIIKMAASYGGDLALSSFGIIQRILFFAVMPGMVIGQGMQPVLGFNYGAERYNLALRSVALALIAATLISIVTFLAVYLFPEPIVSIFTSDPVLIEECTYVAQLVFIAMPLMGFFAVGSQVFLSIGKAVQAFILAIVRPAAFQLPLVILMPHFLELDGVWLSFPVSDSLTFLLVAALLIPLVRYFRKAGRSAAAGTPGLGQDVPPVGQ